ncbi:LysR family transcriptional regulator [Actibacterium sp. MT2.3-13A]|uniref:LysR family transcriptional regulator n=1 Tax=Actibacterium sp. MT2.3-13A TaxID=2828332 RepID=UPI001BAB98BC|nr:LysR family transcriptional regulator [Actibacterium sp. MT2.3-13A]
MTNKMWLPNLRHLAGVLAIARLGTMTDAAAELNLSQPALAQGIAAIERDLGIALFIRSSRGMDLSEAGRLFVARLGRGFGYLDQAARMSGIGNLHRTLTLNQAQSLIAVAESGGIRASAPQIGRSVSAVSRACRRLEDQAGAQLFEQTSTGLRATRRGEELARLIKLALNEMRQAVEDVRSWHGVYTGRLAIGCLPLAQSSILPEALNRFAVEFPEVGPQVVDGYYASLARALRRGDLDFLVGALRRNDLPDGLVQHRLFTDVLVVAAAPAHPLAGVAGVGLNDLAGFPWIAPRIGAPSRSYFEQMHARLSVPSGVPKPIETGSHSVMRGLLMGSERLTLISKTQVARDIRLGLLARIDVELPDSEREIGVTHIEGWLPSVAQARFLEILRDVVRDRAGG